MVILEFSLGRHKGNVQVRVVVDKPGAAPLGHNDCIRVHRAIIPRLELAFPGEELSVEVSSPGIDRTIKDGVEMVHHIGRVVRCYCIDGSADWVAGKLLAADSKGISLETGDGELRLAFQDIAKAKLYTGEEV
jgi:ribosome maturation factor RimP